MKQIKSTHIFKIIIPVAIMLAMVCLFNTKASAKTYTISPGSGAYKNFGSSGNLSRHYYLIRSYLKKLEHGGGTLVLKKGTYKVSNALFVASNTTIKFENGVKIIKTNGNSTSLFQLLADSKYGRKNVTRKYKGEHNIKFIGSGKVIFDLKKLNRNNGNEIGIVMGNNKNVTIKGITFKNIKKGHMIEMDGCKNVKILNCKFMNMTDKQFNNKEAINIDANDKKTGSFSQDWSKRDKTPNCNILVKGCTFKNLVRAVGTHRYSKGKFHTRIQFINNKVEKVKTPVGMINWKNSTVKGNTFTNCKANSRYNYTFLFAGVRNVTFTNNTMKKCKAYDLVKYYEYYQTSYGTYPPTKSKLTKANLKALKNNKSTGGTKKRVIIADKEFNW